MYTLDVCRRESGKIWHRKPTAAQDDGCLATIVHSVPTVLSEPSRSIRFLHADFDVTGDSFIAADHQGHVFHFDIQRNKFSLVQRTGSACTALSFTLRRKTEFLMAMSDYSIKCFDTERKELVSWMKGHAAAIHTLSTHASGRYVISASSETAQLWDLDSFQRRRKLHNKQDIRISKVFFLPMSNTIITCFKDDTIFAWESETLKCMYELKVPEGTRSPSFKCFAATRDGRLLVAAGRSRNIHVWALDTKQLLRVIQMPAKVTSIKQLQFLPDSFDGGANQVLGVLAQDGIMRFININTCKLMFNLASLDDRLSSACVAPNGQHILGVMDSGQLKLYSVKALTSELNQPPPPLMKILKSGMPDDTSKQSGSKKSTRFRLSARERSKNSQENNNNLTNELPDGLSMSRLQNILRGYGAYPDKYRMFIWRSVLRLPENHTAYAALVDKGTHPSFENIHEQYPLRSRKLIRVLQRVLSALAHWSPIFGEADFLPMMAFPFVKLFQNNQLICFEMIASVLVNWCPHWFEYFPNPPINMLGMVENVLANHDRQLLQHFVKHGVTSQTYAWPVLETMFSEVLTKEEWLKLFDNVLSNHPAYLLMVVVAYCTSARGPLMKCSEFDDFKFFFHHRNAVDIGQVIKEAYRLMEITPDEIHPATMVEDLNPLTKGQYPVFNKYPKFIVDYQVHERERIRQEELEYLRQRQAAHELEKETVRRQAEEEAWYRQQQLLADAEAARRKKISEEEHKLTEQRTRLAAMNRELKVREMQVMDATRRKFLSFQQQQKEEELKKLDEDLKKKALLRDIETQAAIDEAEVRSMELQIQRKMLEQELHREHLESTQKQKQEFEARQREQELEERLTRGLNEAQRQHQLQSRKALQHSIVNVDRDRQDTALKRQLETIQQLDDMERQTKATHLQSIIEKNSQMEGEVQQLMREIKEKKESEATEDVQHLNEIRKTAVDLEEERITALEDQVELANRNINNFSESQDAMFERLRDLRRHMGRDDTSSTHSCLNETVDTSQTLSLDRNRQEFEDGERALMSEVRRLREKLAREARDKRPPPAPHSVY